MVSARGIALNAKIFGLMAVLTGVFLGVGNFLGGTSGMFIALILAALMNFGSYWFSDKIVLKLYGAEELPREEAEWLHDALEEMAANAGIPKPKLYKTSMKVPNAFATGRSPEKGVVAVTDGLLQTLEHEEIEGVVAHELAHIRNRDSLINAVVATMAGALALIARIAFWGAMFSGRDREGEMLSSMVFVILVPIIAMLIRFAISRRMEFRADSTGVKIHGKKQPLKSALAKITDANSRSNARASQVQEVGSNLFISNPFSGDSLTKWFSTHPPYEKRAANIEETEI